MLAADATNSTASVSSLSNTAAPTSAARCVRNRRTLSRNTCRRRTGRAPSSGAPRVSAAPCRPPAALGARQQGWHYLWIAVQVQVARMCEGGSLFYFFGGCKEDKLGLALGLC